MFPRGNLSVRFISFSEASTKIVTPAKAGVHFSSQTAVSQAKWILKQVQDDDDF